MKKWIMGTKIFWRIYFWWEIRKAAKRRKQREKEGKSPLI